MEQKKNHEGKMISECNFHIFLSPFLQNIQLAYVWHHPRGELRLRKGSQEAKESEKEQVGGKSSEDDVGKLKIQ